MASITSSLLTQTRNYDTLIVRPAARSLPQVDAPAAYPPHRDPALFPLASVDVLRPRGPDSSENGRQTSLRGHRCMSRELSDILEILELQDQVLRSFIALRQERHESRAGGSTLRMAATRGRTMNGDRSLLQGLATQVVESAKPVIIPIVEIEPAHDEHGESAALRHLGDVTFACVPILVNRKCVFGALGVDSGFQSRAGLRRNGEASRPICVHCRPYAPRRQTGRLHDTHGRSAG